MANLFFLRPRPTRRPKLEAGPKAKNGPQAGLKFKRKLV